MPLISLLYRESIIINATTSAVGTLPPGISVDLNLTDCITDQWFIVMSTQLIGFSIGGVARRFLVAPPSMIWPANLVNCAVFNTLHSQQYAGIGTLGGMSRERFFVITLLAAFAWSEFCFRLGTPLPLIPAQISSLPTFVSLDLFEVR